MTAKKKKILRLGGEQRKMALKCQRNKKMAMTRKCDVTKRWPQEKVIENYRLQKKKLRENVSWQKEGYEKNTM